MGVTLEEVLSRQCCNGGTLLHQAVRSGDIDAVRALLRAGADPGVSDSEGCAVLEIQGHQGIRQTFSDELMRAVAGCEVSRVHTLLSAGLGRQDVDSLQTGNTALHWAACFANKEIVEILVRAGIEVDARNTEGCTPLHDAVGREK